MAGGYGNGIGNAFKGALILAVIGGVILGGIIFVGLPLLWHWLKPIIHAATG